MICPGVTIYIPDTGPPRDRGRPHLFVVLTEPCPDGKILAAPICKVPASGKHDGACPLKVGDHAFIEVDSYVAYAFAQQYMADVLDKQISKNILRTDKPTSAALLARIRQGASASRHIPPIE